MHEYLCAIFPEFKIIWKCGNSRNNEFQNLQNAKFWNLKNSRILGICYFFNSVISRIALFMLHSYVTNMEFCYLHHRFMFLYSSSGILIFSFSVVEYLHASVSC